MAMRGYLEFTKQVHGGSYADSLSVCSMNRSGELEWKETLMLEIHDFEIIAVSDKLEETVPRLI